MQAYKTLRHASASPNHASGCWSCLSLRSKCSLYDVFYRPVIARPTLAPKRFLSTAEQTGVGKAKNALLPDGPARTRFAPSPTGYLHLGSLRTALFNYLLAKKTGGQFLLRIEDTDQKRLVPDAEQRLCDDLRWAGIQWDEGPGVGGPYGPYKQSERTLLYQEHAYILLEKNAVYRCFCPADQAAPIQTGSSLIGSAVGGCQNDCASIPHKQSAERALSGHRHVLRMRKPETQPSWTDLVYGKVSLDKSSKHKLPQNLGVEGVVLLKSDGTPTYHLANVVDDHHMKITHVIRGTEWMASTPLHMALYAAFGWSPPSFAHVGLLTDESQAKLSKRNFETDIAGLREQLGILPEALTNYVALLGWRNPNPKNDVMDMKSLIDAFDLKFTKGNTIAAFGKLGFLQKMHTRQLIKFAAGLSHAYAPLEAFLGRIIKAVKKKYTPEQYKRILGDRDLLMYVKQIVAMNFDRPIDKVSEFVTENEFFFRSDLPAVQPSGAVSSPSSGDSVAAVSNIPTAQSSSASTSPAPQASSDSMSPPGDLAAVESKLDPALATQVAHLMKEVFSDPSVLAVAHRPLAKDAKLSEVHKHNMEAREAYQGATYARIGDATVPANSKLKAAMHVYLREKLMFGNHGPGTFAIMPILGFDECCRRCGLDPASFKQHPKPASDLSAETDRTQDDST